MEYDAYDAILHSLFKKTQSDGWFKPAAEHVAVGVCIRVQADTFRTFPYENPFLAPFETAIKLLNPVVAIKMRSPSIHAALSTISPDATAIYLDGATRIQVLKSMTQIPQAEKEQCGAFLRDERVLVVWSDSVENITGLVEELQQKLIQLIWKNRFLINSESAPSSPRSGATSRLPSESGIIGKEHSSMDTHEPSPPVPAPKKARWFNWKIAAAPAKAITVDPEKASKSANVRPIRLFAPIYGGLGAGLSLFFIASGLNVMLQEWKMDGSFMRFALLATVPLLFCVSLFFSLQIVSNLSMMFGPVAQYHENSKYYSALKPQPNPDVDGQLPHVTIEMPVYKESLEETIMPSVMSIKKAMQTYARQGGTSAIFMHDDGLQLISPEDREARISFYANHNIGWVARPPHSSEEDGYKRAGRFKKASNMNHGLLLSQAMERHIRTLEEAGDDEELEEKALNMALEEQHEACGKRWKTWARNARSMRIGDIILIVDSDTIVPDDCFRDAARELAECPEVGIIQHESDVMQVVHNYFENGITHFTRRINKCISMACANGEVAPFVGHNAFLRWSAMQDASFIDPADGVRKIWAEDRVSEDFDVALRLLLKGYIIRWSTYSRGGFREGVSLTVDDELNRWSKYSFGCNELIFNPLVQWWRKGPITKQLRTFLWSNAPVHYKLSMQAYMYSYYGIAASAILSLVNYAILGFALEIDGYYLKSFEVFLACTVVFPGTGNLAFTLLEYRLGHRSLISAFVESVTWIPFFFFFFGGLSLHLTIAILAHLFSYNIQWGATKKEVERSNFWIEVPKIWKRFNVTFIFSFFCIGGMVILSLPNGPVPVEWRIGTESWAAILPLGLVVACHVLFPIVLNPWLMIFSY
ncbi:glycosyl transferase family group 2-domain-containing protein [Flagelloscypha sp. PMI_526]|nr:glycosyl transferase family group 2-domain-containing protein [Flagelloscypha sp. PMI_526]